MAKILNSVLFLVHQAVVMTENVCTSLTSISYSKYPGKVSASPAVNVTGTLNTPQPQAALTTCVHRQSP